MKRAILGCKNDLIQQRNNEMIELLPGDTFESISIDYCMNGDDNRNVDVNTLNSLEPSGLPPHRLLLKRNACVILMRSLIPRKGFCNGKRCLVKDIRGNLLVVLTPLDGTGPDIFVPRIPMECRDSGLGIPSCADNIQSYWRTISLLIDHRDKHLTLLELNFPPMSSCTDTYMLNLAVPAILMSFISMPIRTALTILETLTSIQMFPMYRM